MLDTELETCELTLEATLDATELEPPLTMGAWETRRPPWARGDMPGTEPMLLVPQDCHVVLAPMTGIG